MESLIVIPRPRPLPFRPPSPAVLPFVRSRRQNDVYDFPDVYVCFYDNFGCDRQDLEESCRDSVFETGRRPMATFNPISSGQQKEAELAPLEEVGCSSVRMVGWWDGGVRCLFRDCEPASFPFSWTRSSHRVPT